MPDTKRLRNIIQLIREVAEEDECSVVSLGVIPRCNLAEEEITAIEAQLGIEKAMTNNFQKVVSELQDQFPDHLTEEDLNTLANVMKAYIWNDAFRGKLKEIEKDFLEESKSTFDQVFHETSSELNTRQIIYFSRLHRLLSDLRNEQPLIVAEAVDNLCMMGAKNTVNLVLPLLEHPSGYVKGSVLRFMSRLHPDKAYPLLIEALKDPDFIVRENAADELGELDRVEAIPYLRPLLADSNPDVQQAAQTAIEMLESIDDEP